MRIRLTKTSLDECLFINREQTLHCHYQNRKKKENTYDAKLNFFCKEALIRLFDICSCKYEDLCNCECSNNCKVSTKVITFLNDQRSSRKMLIGSIDPVESKRFNKLRKQKN